WPAGRGWRSTASSGHSPLPGGELHRLDDLWISRAAAQIARQVVPDLVLARVGYLVEQLARHQDEARRAEAALEGRALDECLLHRIKPIASLDGLHLGIFRKNSRIKTT